MRSVRALAPAALAAVALALTPGAASAAPRPKPVNLDVLFVGAHPDDEAGTLSTLGLWSERHDLRSGVITITRGEGGGNAVGPEEGPALGLLREGEERRAVGRANVRHVYNLDKVDFYYTVSQPLTEEVWGHDDTLARVVRVIRETRPDVLLTMNPSPTPGNHGNHQEAAHMAVEAWAAAADPTAFPEQISREGLKPWRVKRLFRTGAGQGTPTGPDCGSKVVAASQADEAYGVWSGYQSQRWGKSWAQVEREAQREYASQGWAVFPDVPTDPAQLGCDVFTQIASRVPHAVGGTGPDAMLQGALVPAPGGLPLGTELFVTPSSFDVSPGEASDVTVTVKAARRLRDARVALRLPDGWEGEDVQRLGTVARGETRTATFSVTAPAGATPESRARITATLSTESGSGRAAAPVRIAPAVRGTLAPLPEVGQFQQWARRTGVQQLDDLVLPRFSMGVGETRAVDVLVQNTSDAQQSGDVALGLPAGFTADAASKSYGTLAPGATATVTFQVTNTDTSLATSNAGPNGGDYPVTVTTTTASGQSAVRNGALNLVPVTTIPHAAAAPTVDGTEGAGEYGGPQLDLSRVWEGEAPSSPADASGWAKLTWSDDALYVLVHVTDDVLGTVLDPADAKRHWRTDSVEIALDPRGNAPNTSKTFKVGIFPTTNDPAAGNPPAAYRDADAHQGPIAQTAPGMTVASTLGQPYDGYTIETKIPLADLPAAARPDAMGVNVFIYDSDTQDKTGQTRLGWSTWGGVQGDPYRWGHAALEGYTPPADRPTEPGDAIFPREAASSLESGQTILQSSRDGVPVAGGPAAQENARLLRARLTAAGLTVRVATGGAGTVHVHAARSDGRAVASRAVEVARAGRLTIQVPLDAAARAAVADGGLALLAFESAAGGTVSRSRAIATG
jgi:LmbE family N-acetylglucosaminyl deacetylase